MIDTTLTAARRLDLCFSTCLDSPAEAVAKVDAESLRVWLDYAERQIWKPRRFKAFIQAAKKRLENDAN